jgi:esterase
MLFTSRVVTAQAPKRYALFLHGILGTGSNLRALAKGFIEARAAEAWGALLVDLRCHGRSQGLAAPHTLDACVADLVELGNVQNAPIEGIVGHSFGGKVAMLYAAEAKLSYLAVLDSTPSARPSGEGSESVLRVVEALESLPQHFATREDFTRLLLLREGVTPAIAAWLAMNVEADPEHGYRFRVQMPNIRALLADYFARDVWLTLDARKAPQETHFVIAGKGSVLSPADQARLKSLPQVRTTVLPDAGHWVHVDAPDALLRALTSGA